MGVTRWPIGTTGRQLSISTPRPADSLRPRRTRSRKLSTEAQVMTDRTTSRHRRKTQPRRTDVSRPPASGGADDRSPVLDAWFAMRPVMTTPAGALTPPGRLLAGVVSGAVAGAVVAVPAAAAEQDWLSWTVHAVVLGAVLGLLTGAQRRSLGSSFAVGVLAGLLDWAGWQLTAVPLLAGTIPDWSIGDAAAAFDDLIRTALLGAGGRARAVLGDRTAAPSVTHRRNGPSAASYRGGRRRFRWSRCRTAAGCPAGARFPGRGDRDQGVEAHPPGIRR